MNNLIIDLLILILSLFNFVVLSFLYWSIFPLAQFVIFCVHVVLEHTLHLKIPFKGGPDKSHYFFKSMSDRSGSDKERL